jgi:hypothetical protein
MMAIDKTGFNLVMLPALKKIPGKRPDDRQVG